MIIGGLYPVQRLHPNIHISIKLQSFCLPLCCDGLLSICGKVGVSGAKTCGGTSRGAENGSHLQSGSLATHLKNLHDYPPVALLLQLAFFVISWFFCSVPQGWEMMEVATTLCRRFSCLCASGHLRLNRPIPHQQVHWSYQRVFWWYVLQYLGY